MKWDHLLSLMSKLIYIRKVTKANGLHYYELLLVNVDDILAMALVGIIGPHLKPKKSSIHRPSRYLGGVIEHIQTDDGRVIWRVNCIEYMTYAINIVRKNLANDPNPLLKRGDGNCTFPSTYRFEFDFSPELDGIS